MLCSQCWYIPGLRRRLEMYTAFHGMQGTWLTAVYHAHALFADSLCLGMQWREFGIWNALVTDLPRVE